MKLLLSSCERVQKASESGSGLAYFAFLFVILAMPVPSFAAEWSVLPSMSAKGVYSDNLLLTPLPHSSSYGYWISPAAEFAGKTERLEISGKAALDFVEYYGGESSRFTNVFLPLTLRYRTERDEWGLTGGFTRDNTQMGELLTTGLVLRFTQRNLWSVNPTWTRTITENLAFQSTFQFNDASYQDGFRFGLVDHRVIGVSAGFLYHATERDDFQLTGTYTNFRTTNAPLSLRASYPGAMVTLTHAFSENLKGTVYGGPRFISTTSQFVGGDASDHSTIWVYGASLMKQFERAVIQTTLSREIFASGFGLLLQTDRFGISASYKISEAITLLLDTSAYVIAGATRQTRGGELPEQRLLYSTPKLSWHFSEWWTAEISYNHRWRDVDNQGSPVMSNALMFMLTYYPPRLASSQ